MKIFLATPNLADWRYVIEGRYARSVPPVHCTVCGSTWKGGGEAYPTVDADHPDLEPWPDQRTPLVVSEYERLKTRLSAHLPPAAPVRPGAGIGRFTGKVRGKPTELAWQETWTLFLTVDAVRQLLEAGVRVPPCAPTDLKPARTTLTFPTLVEPEIVPLAILDVSGLREPRQEVCARCGRQPGSYEEFIVSAASVPNDMDLFRALNHPGLVLASERFMEAVRAKKLRGCSFRELRTI
jgi:uncharacterized double-CXXCG motif protein